MTEIRHWRAREASDNGWFQIGWWRPESPGILNIYGRIFGRELAQEIVDMLNAKQSSCATGVDGFDVICARGGIGCPLEHTVL